MKLKVTIDNSGAKKKMKRLFDNSSNLNQALFEIANLMDSSVEQNFVEEGRPVKWKALSNRRIGEKEKAGKLDAGILTFSGQLRGSIASNIQGNNVFVGTNKEYAKDHQEGNAKERIPKRPFLLFQKEDIEEYRDILLDHLLKGMPPT